MKLLTLFSFFGVLCYAFVACETLEKIRKSHKHKLRTKKKKEDPIPQAKPDEIVLDKNLQEQIRNLYQPPINPDDLPDLPVYYEGWVKYFHYRDTVDSKKPKSFFQNKEFYKQYLNGTMEKADFEKKDDKGFLLIPSDSYFWVKVLKDTVNLLTTRNNEIAVTTDVMNIDFIQPIAESNKYGGGVKDFGSFEEGSCFQVFTILPQSLYRMNVNSAAPENGIQEIWIFCTKTLEEKMKLMSNIIQIKMQKQRKLGLFVKTKYEVNLENQIKQENLKLDAKKYQINKDNLQPADGYWVLIQDWTQCTLKCGGGLQYQQLVCVPPKNGGKPCDGTPIRTRPCNTLPCPVVKTLQGNPITAKPNNTTLKPIVRAMRVSTRPQRYDKCHLKETDALMTKISREAEEAGFNEVEEKFPVRMVMNDKTVTLYRDDTYKTNLASFLLDQTKFSRVTDKRPCFRLLSNLNEVEICELESSKSNFVEEWDYDFHLFKYQCKKKRPETITASEEKKLEENFKEKVGEAKADVVRDRQQMLKKAVEKNEETLLRKNLQKTEDVTLNAVRKELQLEKMLEKEEKEKEDTETKELIQQIAIEKKKNDCLQKVIKEREVEDQFNLAKEENAMQMTELKEEAKKQIFLKRNEMKAKILAMRKRNERKKNMLKQTLMAVRTEIADNLQIVSKKGSEATCIESKNDEAKINAYCENNFFDNFYKMSDCKDKSSFCYVCCENEFGSVFVTEREQCYNRCDNTPSPTPVKEGRWHWDQLP